jgi:hypothetical protein
MLSPSNSSRQLDVTLIAEAAALRQLYAAYIPLFEAVSWSETLDAGRTFSSRAAQSNAGVMGAWPGKSPLQAFCASLSTQNH